MLCTPDNIIKVGGWNGFSAVGYFFGREIQKTTGQPVGLIGTYWGGTPAQSWTSVEKLASEPALKHYADQLAKTQADYPQALLKFPAIQAAFQASLAKWRTDAGIAINAPVTPADLAKAKAAGSSPRTETAHAPRWRPEHGDHPL